MQALHKLVVTVAGAGYSPLAPGTAGSAVAVLLYILIGHFTDIETPYYIILLLSFVLGWYSTSEMEKIWPHDDSKVVVDEFIGIWISLLFIPYSILNAILAFVLFRIYDIWKPLGIKSIDQKLGGAAGVILDDVLAGAYANLSLQFIIAFIIPRI